ncbi:MAG TPA: alpha/beta hydrolase fold domain-containing protein, partial [Candidatus Babeliaceae bacterium]|nr:alpha/beta hydrolase fold domain-containing protein [Candidatus Babeliaceae bacterium]
MSNKKIVLDNVTAKFVQELEKSKAPPIYTMELQDARSFFDHAQAIVHGQQFPVSQEDITIATDTVANTVNNIYVTLFRPQHTIEPLPIIVYFHGGGWILGNKESFKRLACEIAFKSNAAVAFVNYSPAPETQYPTQIHQAYAATLYFARHGHKHNLDPRRLAIAGDSVGGNMAAVVAILANQQKEPMIQLQVLFYPVTDGSMSSQSYNQFADGPWLTKKAMEWFWDAYCPDKAQRL